VKKHIDVIGSDIDSLYRECGNVLLEIAKVKNPDRDYTKMDELLGEN
jgi:hypothetical protein